MALISSVSSRGKLGEFEVVPTDLTGTDSLAYKPSVTQVLYLFNSGATPVTLVIDGNGVTTVSLPGQGKPISNAAGYSLTVIAGQTLALVLGTISNFLLGTVAVTGGTADVSAWIVEG